MGSKIWSGRFGEEEKSPAPDGIRIPDRPDRSLLAVPITPPWFPNLETEKNNVGRRIMVRIQDKISMYHVNPAIN